MSFYRFTSEKIAECSDIECLGFEMPDDDCSFESGGFALLDQFGGSELVSLYGKDDVFLVEISLNRGKL